LEQIFFSYKLLKFKIIKKLSKLKLNQLSKNEMEKRELNHLRGGCVCSCPCSYSGEQCSSGDDMWGGASTNDNAVANCQQVEL